MPKPKAIVDPEQVRKLAMINCSYEEIASVLGCSVSTIQRRFLVEFQQGRDQGKMSLKRQMWRKAMEKDDTTMQIYLSKNILGYSDRVSQDTQVQINMETEINELVNWLVKIEGDKKIPK